MGELSGIFVAEDYDVRKIVGKRCNFGEVLGKHSDISCVLTETNLRLLTESSEFVATFDEHGMSTGTNPLDYFELEGE